MSRKKKRKPKSNNGSTDRKHFKALTTYMAGVAKGVINRHKIYSLCVKASVCKCFEFNLTVDDFAKSKSGFLRCRLCAVCAKTLSS
jgi:hypothetical protein